MLAAVREGRERAGSAQSQLGLLMKAHLGLDEAAIGAMGLDAWREAARDAVAAEELAVMRLAAGVARGIGMAFGKG